MQWSAARQFVLAAALWQGHIQARAQASNGTTFMVVGDSICHGFEGDYTWRYRLWEWFVDQNISTSFVGPHTGTFPQQVSRGEPTCVEESPSEVPLHIVPLKRTYPRRDSGYAEATDRHWPSAHHCLKGQTTSQLELSGAAALYQPDYVLLQMGTNDLIKKAEPGEVVEELKRLVEEVRAAREDTQFVIATIATTRDFPTLPNLFWSIEETNDLLESAVRDWSTEASPVTTVRIRDFYRCDRQTCLPSWDGVHPNEVGEYQIASAFSEGLHNNFGLGTGPLVVPKPNAIPERPTRPPSNLRVDATPTGLKVTWDKVMNAHKYEVSMRRAGTADWRTQAVQGVLRYDALRVKDGEEWEFRLRVDNAEFYGQPRLSEWTSSVFAVAHPDHDACGQERVSTTLGQLHWFSTNPSVYLMPMWFLLIIITLLGVVQTIRSRMTKHYR